MPVTTPSSKTTPVRPVRKPVPLKPATPTGRVITPTRSVDHRAPTTPVARSVQATCPAELAVAPVPTVAASPAESVAAALRGVAVRLPLDGAEAPGLALRELIPRGEQRAFEAGLGKLRFEVVMPESADASAVLGRMLPMLAQVPEPVRSAIRRVTIQPTEPASPAYAIELADARGRLTPLLVQRIAADEKTATYAVSDANGRFELHTPPDGQDAWEVAQAFHLWAMIPVPLRSALKTITVADGPNPTDAYWAEAYKNPEFTSAATGGNGATNFWHGTKFMKEEYFLHEFGHVLGQTYSTSNALIPDGWADAMAADNRTVTRYGENSPAEDFAESFMVYLKLQKGDRVTINDPPADLAGFAARWPRRAAILDAIFRGDRRPSTR